MAKRVVGTPGDVEDLLSAPSVLPSTGRSGSGPHQVVQQGTHPGGYELDASSVMQWVDRQQPASITPETVGALLREVPPEDQMPLMISVLQSFGQSGAALTKARADAQVALIGVAVDKLGGLSLRREKDRFQIAEIGHQIDRMDATAYDKLAVERIKAEFAATNEALQTKVARAHEQQVAESKLASTRARVREAELESIRATQELDAKEALLPQESHAARLSLERAARERLWAERRKTARSYLKHYAPYGLAATASVAVLVALIVLTLT